MQFSSGQRCRLTLVTPARVRRASRMPWSGLRTLPVEAAMRLRRANLPAGQGHRFKYAFVPECRFLIGFSPSRYLGLRACERFVLSRVSALAVFQTHAAPLLANSTFGWFNAEVRPQPSLTKKVAALARISGEGTSARGIGAVAGRPLLAARYQRHRPSSRRREMAARFDGPCSRFLDLKGAAEGRQEKLGLCLGYVEARAGAVEAACAATTPGGLPWP